MYVQHSTLTRLALYYARDTRFDMHDMSSGAVEQFALDTIAVIIIMPGNPALYTICTHTQIEKNVHGIPLIVLCASH